MKQLNEMRKIKNPIPDSQTHNNGYRNIIELTDRPITSKARDLGQPVDRSFSNEKIYPSIKNLE